MSLRTQLLLCNLVWNKPGQDFIHPVLLRINRHVSVAQPVPAQKWKCEEKELI
jgi:hypothetical protein